MTHYVESSAVLAWLLGEDAGAAVRAELERAEAVTTSQLTLVECERALMRAARSKRITVAEAGTARAALAGASVHWSTVDVTQEVLDRARRPFPEEPVRTLDALHLGTLLLLQPVVADLSVVSLDERIRTNSALLGIRVLPPA